MEHQCPVHGGRQRNPPVHPRHPQQSARLRPGADGMQGTAVRGSSPGRADQRREASRIDERDPVQVHNQRPAVVRQL